MKITASVGTTIDRERSVVQIYDMLHFEDPGAGLQKELERINRRVNLTIVDLREAAIRDALIELGWTPPAQLHSQRELLPDDEAPRKTVSPDSCARDYDLFAEYVDPDNALRLTRESFELQPLATRLEWAKAVFEANK
ncbi:hypothetical protein UFOVP707_90 [uncultured Caudovirales phage]|uniref:Uncharacterized protein n=1 Tax=uncultured Caudovirales phage TaxID=2100421 RepID=A0A6J5NPR6_9CAUD|nr:hypothetical protein UFOVP707_90 [uncultured Caudovirales phage]